MKGKVTITIDFEDKTEEYIDNIPKHIVIQADGMYMVNGKVVKLKKGDTLPMYTEIKWESYEE